MWTREHVKQHVTTCDNNKLHVTTCEHMWKRTWSHVKLMWNKCDNMGMQKFNMWYHETTSDILAPENSVVKCNLEYFTLKDIIDIKYN